MIVRRSASLVARLSSNLCSRNRRSLGSSAAGPAAADAVVPRNAMVSNVAHLPLALDVGGSVGPRWSERVPSTKTWVPHRAWRNGRAKCACDAHFQRQLAIVSTKAPSRCSTEAVSGSIGNRGGKNNRFWTSSACIPVSTPHGPTRCDGEGRAYYQRPVARWEQRR